MRSACFLRRIFTFSLILKIKKGRRYARRREWGSALPFIFLSLNLKMLILCLLIFILNKKNKKRRPAQTGILRVALFLNGSAIRMPLGSLRVKK
jgi:hypothetical protein